jgi:hypothetical protein
VFVSIVLKIRDRMPGFEPNSLLYSASRIRYLVGEVLGWHKTYKLEEGLAL